MKRNTRNVKVRVEMVIIRASQKKHRRVMHMLWDSMFSLNSARPFRYTPSAIRCVGFHVFIELHQQQYVVWDSLLMALVVLLALLWVLLFWHWYWYCYCYCVLPLWLLLLLRLCPLLFYSKPLHIVKKRNCSRKMNSIILSLRCTLLHCILPHSTLKAGYPISQV